MFINESNEKIFQTLPGQGWQALIDWNTDAASLAEGEPRYTLEPIIAWVTARIERKNECRVWEDVVITGLVRDTSRGELVLLDSRDGLDRAFVFLAPGESLSEEHFTLLKGGYRNGVQPRG